MLSAKKLAFVLAAAASTVYAIDATQSAELNAILNDAKNNLAEYISVANQVSVPPEIFQIGLAIATATDDSYTTFYSQIDFNQVSSLMTALPWYSTRLQPEISSALATITATGTSSSAKSTSASESSSSSSETPSSTITSSASSKTPSSSVKSSESSSEAPSSSVTSQQSSKISSTASLVSQTSDGQLNQQTSNGAAKATVGMGAGVLAAAALLL